LLGELGLVGVQVRKAVMASLVEVSFGGSSFGSWGGVRHVEVSAGWFR